MSIRVLTIKERKVSPKKYFYLAGLPRTGSTVLGEILNQNENIHVSPASPLSEIISEILTKWRQNIVTLRAYKHPDQLANVWRGVRDGMYQHRRENIIFDKSWAWHMNDAIDSTRDILGEEAKVICTVDNITDCLASFIMLIRSNPDYQSFIDAGLQHKNMQLTDENRCLGLMDPGIATSVGWCYANLKKTWSGRNRNNLLLIEREDLVANPVDVIAKVVVSVAGQPPTPGGLPGSTGASKKLREHGAVGGDVPNDYIVDRQVQPPPEAAGGNYHIELTSLVGTDNGHIIRVAAL